MIQLLFIALLQIGVPPLPQNPFCGTSPSDWPPPNVGPGCECVEERCMDAAKDAYQDTMVGAADAACSPYNGALLTFGQQAAQCRADFFQCLDDGWGYADCNNEYGQCVVNHAQEAHTALRDISASFGITHQGAVIQYLTDIGKCCVDCDR